MSEKHKEFTGQETKVEYCLSCVHFYENEYGVTSCHFHNACANHLYFQGGNCHIEKINKEKQALKLKQMVENRPKRATAPGHITRAELQEKLAAAEGELQLYHADLHDADLPETPEAFRWVVKRMKEAEDLAKNQLITIDLMRGEKDTMEKKLAAAEKKIEVMRKAGEYLAATYGDTRILELVEKKVSE